MGAAVASAVALLGGCGGEPEPPPPQAATVTTPPTVRALAAVKAALLSPADIPGSKPVANAGKTDVSTCFPDNPLGMPSNPFEVVGPDLSLVQGKVERTYGSSATQAGPKQAAAYVATFASPTGSACLINVIKTAIAGRQGSKTDASALTGTVKPAAVGEAGALLSVRGNLKVSGASVPLAFDLLTFHVGSLMVLVSASALRGPAVANQAVDLGKKVASRLP